MQYVRICLCFEFEDLIMKKKIDPINPELAKLEAALQKALSAIKKQSYDDNVSLFLFFSIVLLKDGLLKAFRNIIVHSLEELDTKNIFQKLTPRRSSYYKKILQKIQSIGINQQVIILIYNYFESVNPNAIKDEEYVIAFENLLDRLNDFGKRDRAVSLLPKEIINIIYQLDNQESKSVYNPYSGFGDLAFHSSINNYYGEEKNIYLYTLHLIRALVHGYEEKINLVNHTPSYKDISQNDKYDLVVSMPPIKQTLKNEKWYDIFNDNNNSLKKYEDETHEQLYFKYALQRLRPNGKIISIIAQSFLKEGGTSKIIIQGWVENNKLETIIALPILMQQFNTAVQFYIIVLGNKPNMSDQVRYIDGRSLFVERGNREKTLDISVVSDLLQKKSESSHLKFIDTARIRKNNFDLSANSYFLKKYEGKKIREICAEIKNAKRGVIGVTGKVVKLSDLKNDKNDYLIQSGDLVEQEVGGLKEIAENCLLLSLVGGRLRPTYFVYAGEPIYIFPTLIALRIDTQKVDINYLINELHQGYIKEQLIDISSGSLIPILRKDRLLEICVDVDKTTIDQKKLVQKIDSSIESDLFALKEAKIQIEKLRKSFLDDVRSKEHNILQFLSASQSAALMIDHIISIEANISKENKELISRQINSLRKSLFSASYNIRRLSEEMNFDTKEDCDVNLLINEAIAQGINNSTQFSIDYTFHKDSFYIPLEQGVESMYIDPISFISRNDFFILYNNILENAIKHGFTDKGREYKFKVDLYCIRENKFSDSLTIVFSNNGNPMPKGMAEAYSIRGEKAGDTANEGIGSWKVHQIVKEHFKGDIKVIDTPTDEYPVKIEIKLPLVGWTDDK